MGESKGAVEKLQRIQQLWVELGCAKVKTPAYDALLEKISALSAEYQLLLDASNDAEQSR